MSRIGQTSVDAHNNGDCGFYCRVCWAEEAAEAEEGA